MTDKTKELNEVAGDRGASVVAFGKRTNVILIALMFIVAGILVILVITPKESQEMGLVKTENEEFNPGIVPRIDLPKPNEMSFTPAEQAEPEKPSAADLKAEQDRLLEQLKYQQELQRFIAARRHSPMLIYDQGTKNNSPAVDPSSTSETSDPTIVSSTKIVNSATQSRSSMSSSIIYAERLEDLNYVLAQGKFISGILESAIQSDLPGMVRAVVSEDVYSENGVTVLMPRGSRLIGEYRSGLTRGQTRLFVIWSRLIRPDGIHVTLTSPGTDSLGRSGLTGVVDNHYIERFGAAVLLSIIGALSATQSNQDVIYEDATKSMSELADEALKDSINIPPTIHIDQGTPIKIFLAKDLNFKRVLDQPISVSIQ